MFNSSPITSWDGAGAIFTYFDGGTGLWFALSVICCIIPLYVAFKAEQKSEEEHQ